VDEDSGGKPYPPLFRRQQRIGLRGLRCPLALTQTFAQLCAGYPPFWLSKSRFRAPAGDINTFIRTFYTAKEDIKYASAELYISYKYDSHPQPPNPIDLTLVTLLRAYSPGFRCVFRSAEILDWHRRQCPTKYYTTIEYSVREILQTRWWSPRSNSIHESVRVTHQERDRSIGGRRRDVKIYCPLCL
jgi:hypothetical protein